jgi:uncharacterized protein YcbK (DUF882 family)
MADKSYVAEAIKAKDEGADEQLSAHFKKSEFNQRRRKLKPKDYTVDSNLVDKLEQLRKSIGDKPIKVTSGYRTEEYNRLVGGARKSQHMQGKAADIMVEGMTAEELKKHAKKVGFSYTETYKTKPHLHVDVGPVR